MSSNKDKRKARVNGNKYHIVIEETSRHRRVSVYDDSTVRKNKNDNDIVYQRESKGRILWYGKDTAPSVEEMVKECLNEAVCILEEKKERQEEYEDRIDRAIKMVEEAHEG